VSDEFRTNASPEMRGLLDENLAFGANSRDVHIDGEPYTRMALNARRQVYSHPAPSTGGLSTSMSNSGAFPL
jgi:hypothetical protein